MRRRPRIDGNHAEIVDVLRKCGWLVQSLAGVGDGVPDLVACRPATNRIVLIEVKVARGKPTKAQDKFQAEGWPVITIRSVSEAVALGRVG